MEIARGRTKGEVEMTLASDALGSPDIAPFLYVENSGLFWQGWGRVVRLCRVVRVKVVFDVTAAGRRETISLPLR